MEFLTVVNRSSKTLKGVWDGRHYDITPGKHTFPTLQALKFKDQNPIMGSENPYTLQRQYLIGIEEYGDNIDPIEQSKAVERWDRSVMGSDGDVVVIKGHGEYRPGVDASAPLGNDSSFVPPGVK